MIFTFPYPNNCKVQVCLITTLGLPKLHNNIYGDRKIELDMKL